MSSQLHPSNPPISGRLKIISLVGTRPHCAICTPAGAITRSGQFSLFSFPRPYFLPSSLPLLHDEQSHPFASFLFPLSPLRLRRDKLRTLKFGAPATTPLYFQPRGLAHPYEREREVEKGKEEEKGEEEGRVHARGKARIVERNVHGNYTAYANLEGKSLLVGGARVYSLLLERKLMEGV